MDLLFLGIIIFLFILAVFDLTVGVSNDASNFLTSAIGSKAASFRTVIIIASIGVLLGAASSNGMMDIARHGIFRPEYFSFYDLICVFMAVMVTDIILLDVFNNLGMPTSTTVSLIFDLLGAAFAIALIKLWNDESGLSLMNMINTEKALSVILGIFLSVAIAFVFGMVVQFIARSIFSFEYKSTLKWKIGIFGGVATTAIIYFLLIKGAKEFVWMTPEIKDWIGQNTALILAGCFLFFTLLMQLLHALKVNVLKIVVLIGTFALAMAFAGNDLVNFIGVPLTGFASYQDYMANAAGNPDTHMMNVLNEPANTPIYFLIGAGIIMVIALATSKKARSVTQTANNLSAQSSGEEMFGSSALARSTVRAAININSWLKRVLPLRVRRWIDRRFDTSKMTLEQGASFDLIRASVNLMLAGVLIAVGTSMKLPLSTTFVTFMVAMGSSLADRAWGRESAVFRITGVISVIGGWFVTAGVAFFGAGLIAALMHWGGAVVMIIIALVAVAIIIRSNIRYKEKKADDEDDKLFQTILTTNDSAKTWELLKTYIARQQRKFIAFASEKYREITDAFVGDDFRTLNKAEKALYKEKTVLKTARRKETMCLRLVAADTAIEYSSWFHMANNMCMAMNYNLRRITESVREHVGNNFRPLPKPYVKRFAPIQQSILEAFTEAEALIGNNDISAVASLRTKCDQIKDDISEQTHAVYGHIRNGASYNLTVIYVYLNLLQESQEMVSSLRKLLRAAAKLNNGSVPVRRYMEQKQD